MGKKRVFVLIAIVIGITVCALNILTLFVGQAEAIPPGEELGWILDHNNKWHCESKPPAWWGNCDMESCYSW